MHAYEKKRKWKWRHIEGDVVLVVIVISCIYGAIKTLYHFKVFFPKIKFENDVKINLRDMKYISYSMYIFIDKIYYNTKEKINLADVWNRLLKMVLLITISARVYPYNWFLTATNMSTTQLPIHNTAHRRWTHLGLASVELIKLTWRINIGVEKWRFKLALGRCGRVIIFEDHSQPVQTSIPGGLATQTRLLILLILNIYFPVYFSQNCHQT